MSSLTKKWRKLITVSGLIHVGKILFILVNILRDLPDEIT